MNDRFFITIGRQLGSGGRVIGEKLASRLGISFYDKELILLASQESGLGKEFFEQADEKKSHSLFAGLLGIHSSRTDDYFSGYYLSNETLFKIQSEVIRELADKDSSVFVGRCADYVLKDYARCINVFVSADLNDRIKRIAKIQQIPEKKAAEIIEKTDRKRAEYYNYYSNKVWGAAASYHLCINSSVLGIDETASFLFQFVKYKLGLQID